MNQHWKEPLSGVVYHEPYASESMYLIGNDGLLYVDYCCDGICTPFVEANAGMFDEAREEAVKAAEKDVEELNG